MNAQVVAIVGSPLDGHVEAVERGLKELGVEVMVFDSLSFPDGPTVALTEISDSIAVNGRPLGRPAAVYLREMHSHALSFGLDVNAEMEQDWRRTLIALREKSDLLFGLLSRWSDFGVPMYNSTAPGWRFGKPFQLALLQRAGLPVPETLWTNDPAAVREFSSERRVIYKPISGGAATRELGPNDLTDDRLRALSGAPVTFQELLDGDNFRVYCIDGEVVAGFRITSAEIDYRQNEETIEQTSLPANVLGDCIRAAEVLGVRWAGIDLRDDGKGNLRFLEVNPSPMFMGFDARGGTNILGALVDALASHTSKS
jgi:glutathione synthase/RimK-type ligase-like ATP-grasp enzyme